jgi:hypothetical protein
MLPLNPKSPQRLAANDGVEPPSPGSEPGILPLNESAANHLVHLTIGAVAGSRTRVLWVEATRLAVRPLLLEAGATGWLCPTDLPLTGRLLYLLSYRSAKLEPLGRIEPDRPLTAPSGVAPAKASDQCAGGQTAPLNGFARSAYVDRLVVLISSRSTGRDERGVVTTARDVSALRPSSIGRKSAPHTSLGHACRSPSVCVRSASSPGMTVNGISSAGWPGAGTAVGEDLTQQAPARPECVGMGLILRGV